MSGAVTTPPGLWRPTALTDALMAPAVGEFPAASLDELRVTLTAELRALIADLPGSERLVLDGYRLRIAAFDPERCAGADVFTPSPKATRRAIGVAAVQRCVQGRSPAPVTAVREVLYVALEEVAATVPGSGPGKGPRPPWWAEFYRGLGPGGRAVVEAEAVTWSTHLWTALAWERFDHVPAVGGRDDWWACPGARQLTLKGRAEVRAPCGDRHALLVVAGGVPTPGWRIELGFPALVAALVRGERGAPVRVVGTWPVSGQFRVLEVDADALVEVARAVVSATGTWVDAALERR